MEVPRDIDSYWVYWDGIERTTKVSNNSNWTTFSKKLEGNPNDYKIIGLLRDLSESECEWLVEKVMNGHHYQNYNYTSITDRWVKTAKDSLISLLQSNGLNTSNNLLLIEKK